MKTSRDFSPNIYFLRPIEILVTSRVLLDISHLNIVYSVQNIVGISHIIIHSLNNVIGAFWIQFYRRMCLFTTITFRLEISDVSLKR
jgi:hypothetical protein